MLSQDYVVGLVDGEGSFTAYLRNPDEPKTVKRRVVAEPRFYIKLIEKDKDILYKLKEFFGCGNVYFQKDSRKNHQNCYRYEVTSRTDLLQRIIPFFKKYQPRLVSKRKDFEIFCELLEGIQKGEHLSESGLRRLYQVKKQMH